jgi:maltooligosyltrehalose trehalohydrolase
MAATVMEHAMKSKRSHHGPLVDDMGTAFRVWAPERKRVDVVLVDSNGREQRKVPLVRDAEGYFSEHLADVTHGALYFYQIDGDPQNYPDPAANFQPQGVHGPSQVIDHRQFAWSDHDWPGVQMRGQVIYEMHIGAFTPEGNWRAAIDKLPHLRDVGITLLQVMPVAAFPGEFGWGYDGVYWFAPTQLYGTPDDMRTFVDRAHALGMGVVLDCVYNHLGPCGNYTTRFSPSYFSEKHHTEWGEAINFDGPHCGPVRDFVADNAAYWVRDFHIDGLRLDAVQAIIDDSDEHIVALMTRTARKAAGRRSIVIYSEDELNRGHQVLPIDQGGWGTDGILNDDFHHSCRVAATGNAEGYYSDYAGSPQELVSAIRHGHLYQGQHNTRQAKPRGRPSGNVGAEKFVHFLQNHDQVANSARGSRTHSLTTAGRHRALTTLLLLGPQTPMLFMGQEFSASNSFYYFADHEPELAKRVGAGRREFMSQFPRLESFKDEFELVDPAEESTFLACKLDWDEVQRHAHIVELHRDLIRLRREDPVFSRQDRSAVEGSVIGPEAFLLRWFGDDYDDRLALFNLGRDIPWSPVAEPLLAPPPGGRWTVVWSSEEPYYGGLGTPNFDGKTWRVPGHAAVVFKADGELAPAAI